MYNLIKYDLFRLGKSSTMRVILGLVFGCSLLWIICGCSFSSYASTDGFCSLFKTVFMVGVIPITVYGAILAGTFIGGDFENRTIQDGISCGHGREKIVLSKMLMFMLAILIILLAFPLIVCLGYLICGKLTFTAGAGEYHDLFMQVAAYSLAFCSQLSLFVFLAFLIRKTGLTIIWAISLVFLLPVVGSILAGQFPAIEKLFVYIPLIYLMSQLSYLGSAVDFTKVMLVSVIYVVVFLIATYYIFRRAEVK